VNTRYRIRPKANQDLDEQALYLAVHGTPELGHRFLRAAREAFAVLTKRPHIAGALDLKMRT
jgi:plasmid stabilization system protein ParE